MYELKDIATARGEMLTEDQRRKLSEADANVSRTQLPLRGKCLVALSLLYHGIAHVLMFHAIAVQGSLMRWSSCTGTRKPR